MKLRVFHSPTIRDWTTDARDAVAEKVGGGMG
jgi:hypothetical protein